MSKITIEFANGERDSFSLPRRFAGWVADSLASKMLTEVEIDGKRYAVEARDGLLPLWRLLDGDGLIRTEAEEGVA